MLISICIVTLQACDYLRNCLRSIAEFPPSVEYEIIVVDNGSTDGSLEMLRREYPAVVLIANPHNQGFTAPMNQALRAASGDFLLQLNPDTIVQPYAFDRLLAFMQSHTDVGICGPKVLNPDGTLQGPCRRGESRPLAVIGYFTRLYKLFPRSRPLGEYLLSYMPEDEAHPVAGVAGSCMFIRRSVVDQIGYLDEEFFAYQEDADYCFRARQAGWHIYYVPDAQIVHYGGRGGSRVQPYRSIIAWHRSYHRYYHKNLARDYCFLFNWFYDLLIGAKLLWALSVNALRSDKYAGPRR